MAAVTAAKPDGLFAGGPSVSLNKNVMGYKNTGCGMRKEMESVT